MTNFSLKKQLSIVSPKQTKKTILHISDDFNIYNFKFS